MNHFVPKFSNTDIYSPNYSELSSDDRISIGLTQNTIATFASSDAIIKSSERQFKDVLSNMNHNAMLSRVIAENQLDEAIETNHNLRLLNNTINSLDIKLSSLLDLHTITNNKLDELIRVTGIPEFEKERLFYFSEGIKFIKQSEKCDRRFKDALENLTKSYSINSTDYVTSYMLSSIYLYNESLMDLKKSEEILLKSIDYSSSIDDKFTANSYKHLAYCQLLQYKLDDAIDSCKDGYKLDNSIIDLYIIEIECEVLLNNRAKFIKLMKNLCKKDINNINYLLSSKTIIENEIAKSTINGIINKFDKEYYKSVSRLRYLDRFIRYEYSDVQVPMLFDYIDNLKSPEELYSFFEEPDFSFRITKFILLNNIISGIEKYLNDNYDNIDNGLDECKRFMERNKNHNPIKETTTPASSPLLIISMIIVISLFFYLIN